jgi:hypothetical protein
MSKGSLTAFIAAHSLVFLAGCATRPTVDDGRALSSQLILDMQDFGEAAAEVRPAIVRSAAMADSGCDNQYELPFDAITTDGIADADTKIAWERALGVDDNLTVIAADRSSGLRAGEIVAEVDGYKTRNKAALAARLADARDRGEPFELGLASGERVTVSPFRLCRGHVLVAPPLTPTLQRYHWAESIHPLELFHQPLTKDEAQWIVLWTQGLSETGGARMKGYAFMVGTVKWLSVLGLGFATSSAAASSRAAAASAGTSATGQVAATQLAGQAASLMAQSAANQASLTGVSHVAAGVFDLADQWAFDNMRRLGMNPRAGLSLHEKLIAHGAAANAFLLDDKRLAHMRALVAGLPGESRTAAGVGSGLQRR